MKHYVGLLLLLVCTAAPVPAQPVGSGSTYGVRFVFTATGRNIASGSGSPNGVRTGDIGDLYLRTDGSSFETLVYVKSTGTGNTGWVTTGGITGSGTTDYLPKWTAATTLGNSSIYESGGNLGLGTTTTTYKVTAGGVTAPATGYAYDLGAYLRKWLTIHAAELRVETLVAAETMATIGGRVVVAPTTQLTADLANAATTMYVKHNALADGDRVRLEAEGNVEWIAVASAPGGAGPYSYTITRNLDGSGANDWVAGDAVLNTGTTGDGYIDLYSDRSTRSATHYGPSIVGNVRTGTTYSNLEERWAIGNLNGVFGYATDTYGAAFGSPTGAWLKIDPTNGVRLGHNTTTKVQIEADGDATFAGSVTATAGAIGGWVLGATQLADAAGAVGLSSAVTAGDDIRLWAGDATPASAEFRVTEAGALTATSATITGAITATSGSFTGTVTSTAGTIGGWTLGATSLTGGNATLAASGNLTLGSGNDVFRASADDATYRAWIGNATAASAPFRVTKAGTLTATDAAITGTVSAARGAVTIDSSGITIDNGSSGVNQVKWDDGSSIGSSGDIMALEGTSGIYLYGAAAAMRVGDHVEPTTSGAIDLGSTSLRWHDLWLEDDVHHFGDYYWDSPPTTTAADYPIVWSPSIKVLYQKTDGSSASGCTTVTAEAGIVTSCADPITGPLTQAVQDISLLKQEVAELRAQVAALLALLGGRQ